ESTWKKGVWQQEAATALPWTPLRSPRFCKAASKLRAASLRRMESGTPKFPKWLCGVLSYAIVRACGKTTTFSRHPFPVSRIGSCTAALTGSFEVSGGVVVGEHGGSSGGAEQRFRGRSVSDADGVPSTFRCAGGGGVVRE